MHFYGIDLTDTLSLRPRRRFSALRVSAVVRWKNGPHFLRQNSFFYMPPLCKQVLLFTISCSLWWIEKVLLRYSCMVFALL